MGTSSMKVTTLVTTLLCYAQTRKDICKLDQQNQQSSNIPCKLLKLAQKLRAILMSSNINTHINLKLHETTWVLFQLCRKFIIFFLKGTVSRDFRLLVFIMNQFLQAPEYTIGVVSNFFENLRRYSQLKVWHVNDTGGKCKKSSIIKV